MRLEPTDQQERLRDRARRFAQDGLEPLAARHDREARFGPSVLPALASEGLMGVNLLARLGGLEAGVVAYSLALSAIARACASTAVTMAVTNMVGEVIAAYGTPAQQKRWIPRLCNGEACAGAFALSEAEAGSDAGALQTRATRRGDVWELHGSKQWISHANLAGVLVVWARTGEPGPGGLSAFLVEGDAKGLIMEREEKKMGLRASPTVALRLEGCRAELLGDLHEGFRIAMTALDGGRIGIASQSIGLAECALDHARRHVRDHGGETRLHDRLADARVRLEAMRWLTLRAAWLKEQNRAFTREASIAKLFASEGAWSICNTALQTLGEAGLAAPAVAERCFRDARVTRIYEGTSEIQRMVIARSML